MKIPIVDIGPLFDSEIDKKQLIARIHDACQEYGFFYITGHGVSISLQENLQRISRRFFNQPVEKKQEIAMERGGKAWRGYFPVESELTSGKPDIKEGLYFGEELSQKHPKVTAGVPLHGSNLFPDIPGFDILVLEYMKQMGVVGKLLMQCIALSLELPVDFFERRYMTNPLQLFRIFHYPTAMEEQLERQQWGVGEHTDYGVLTILKQDDTGGLQVYTKENWIDAPSIENSFICNIGDMLDLMTGGYYRSTPHRVLNTSGRGRLSFPFFYDLDFEARPAPIDLSHIGHKKKKSYLRWDKYQLNRFSGSYGEYLVDKVSKVFPQLKDNML